MRAASPFLALLCAIAMTTPAARAQRGSMAEHKAPTFASILDANYREVEEEVVSAAEAMPEDKYSFAPTHGDFKGVRTFAEEVKHIAFANHLYFGPLMGETFDTAHIESEANGPQSIKTKAEIVKYLKDSFALGHRAIATFTAENLITPLPKPVFPFLSTRLTIADIATWHPMDHYGQMVEYLRMNGIIPPASRPRPAPQSRPKQ
jgi:DinB superfamily